MWVFSEIMGLPVEDRKLIIELGDKILGNTDPEVVGEENVVALALRDPSYACCRSRARSRST